MLSAASTSTWSTSNPLISNIPGSWISLDLSIVGSTPVTVPYSSKALLTGVGPTPTLCCTRLRTSPSCAPRLDVPTLARSAALSMPTRTRCSRSALWAIQAPPLVLSQGVARRKSSPLKNCLDREAEVITEDGPFTSTNLMEKPRATQIHRPPWSRPPRRRSRI